jgi:hypothetical protein
VGAGMVPAPFTLLQWTWHRELQPGVEPMAISDGDKLAAATLAAAKCAASGQHEVKDYMAQYEDFVRSFEELNKAKQSKGGQRKMLGF